MLRLSLRQYVTQALLEVCVLRILRQPQFKLGGGAFPVTTFSQTVSTVKKAVDHLLLQHFTKSRITNVGRFIKCGARGRGYGLFKLAGLLHLYGLLIFLLGGFVVFLRDTAILFAGGG